MKITTKKYAEGKYEIRINGRRIPGLIIGARKKYMLEYCEPTLPNWRLPAIGPFKTITAAASHAADLYQLESASGSK